VPDQREAEADPVVADASVVLPTFYEFFCGGGLVRVALSDCWHCVGAIDSDPSKIAAYTSNFGSDGLVHDDIRNLRAADLPEIDMAWASFPCSDVSVAGTRLGLAGPASGAWWPCWSLLSELVSTGRAPGVIAVENVRGLLGSDGGRDFISIVGAMISAGYRVGAVLLDARDHLPQSRVRVFIVGIQSGVSLPSGLVLAEPDPRLHPSDMRKVVAALPDKVRRAWVWWHVPAALPHNTTLRDILDPDGPHTKWHTPAEKADLLDTMAPLDVAKVERAKATGTRQVGTIYVRSRKGVIGRTRRANVRLDGSASCIVTPNGKSSAQIILTVEGDVVRTRAMTIGEASRLMGLPNTYRMPRGYNAGFQLCGDGVAIPVVRHLSEHLLMPLATLAASWRPRTTAGWVGTLADPARARCEPEATVPDTLPTKSGIKSRTIGTTLYLLPHESRRIRQLAAELDLSVHELMLVGLDRMLAQNGQRPLERYSTPARGSGIRSEMKVRGKK
jgi:DNA (cytosine-5)-methyltransferase 1